jgi:ribose-phosphate pyrophosphokinase
LFIFWAGETLKIISGTGHRALAESIAAHLGQPLAEVDIRTFPDGETFVKIVDSIRGQDVFIVQPVCDAPNERLMELLITIDAARRASALRITAVIPYFGYARQDRKDQPRVPITAKLVANLLTAAGANRLITMDLHSQQIQGFFDIPVDHLTALPVFVRELRRRNCAEMVICAPDTGGVKQAYAYSQKLGCGLAIAAKQRRNAQEVEAIDVVGEVKNRDVVLVDDLVTTAGTLCGAASLIKRNGARSITAVVTHSVLTPDGVQRLKKSCVDSLMTTDSVPTRAWGDLNVTVLPIGELFAEAILRIHNNQSVNSLFRI